MANEVEIINGVTKREKDGDFTYDFPKAVIKVLVTQDTFRVTLVYDAGNPITTKFADVTDKLGQATLEDYVDFLATERYYFEVDPAGTGLKSDIWVIVQTPGDLPDPVAGVISLITPDTIYLFVGTVDLVANRIVIAASNIMLRGLNPSVDGITSTTTGDLITVTNESIALEKLLIIASSSSGILKAQGTSVETCSLNKVTLTGGTQQIDVTNYFIFVLSDSILQSGVAGILISGTMRNVSISASLFQTISGIAIDLNGVVADALRIHHNTCVLQASSTFLAIAAASANIALGGLGTLTDNTMQNTAGGTIITGYSPLDLGWLVLGNNGIVSSDRILPTGWGYYQDGETAPATIVATTTPQLLQNDGAGANTETGFLPQVIRGISELWTADKITPIIVGDSYDLRIDLEITAKTGSVSSLILQLDIGGGAAPTIVIVERSVSVAKTAPFQISVGFPIFCLANFLTNGGQIFLSTDANTLTVAHRAVLVSRNSSGAS